MQNTGAILKRLEIKALNPMQAAAGEAYGTHNNIVLLSPTGSGKTLAYLLPLLPLLQEANGQTKAVIIAPSRELAQQIEQVFKSMGTGLKITCCYGGHKREIEENNLVEPPALIVGTAGRLADHIRRGNITTASVEALVLDEFDKCLELGFQEEMAFIMASLTGLQKRVFISATQMDALPDFTAVTEPFILNFLPGEGAAGSRLEVKTVQSPEADKIDTLFRLLCMANGRPAIVFCNHRDAVERTSALLKEKDIVNVFYHGAMEQQERDAALCKFRNGTSNVLVTTDLAARGLDIDYIRYIIHYHLPQTEDIFTHRNGRTARMDASGTAILILGPDEVLPEFIVADTEKIALPGIAEPPEKPKWSTLFIAAGKKDKVNKVDIVGFLTQKGNLKMEDIGLIEVKDFFSFAGIRKSRMHTLLPMIQQERIKNKKVKMAVAK
jgi:superfamily II DNA/RNA helicase